MLFVHKWLLFGVCRKSITFSPIEISDDCVFMK